MSDLKNVERWPAKKFLPAAEGELLCRHDIEQVVAARDFDAAVAEKERLEKEIERLKGIESWTRDPRTEDLRYRRKIEVKALKRQIRILSNLPPAGRAEFAER